MTECEASLLGREAIHGSANAIALASLVKTLTRKSELRRRYVLRCSRDHGLQMVPSRRLEDEGFESDEDLTSLGSCEDGSSSIYVSDHAVRAVKCVTVANGGGDAVGNVRLQNTRSSSQLGTGTEPATGSVSSVGTDSANSSGASDNDETDCSGNSLSHNVNHKTSTNIKMAGSGGGGGGESSTTSSCSPFDSKKKFDEIERFAFHEVAFCHTDPSLPKIIVWVVKTKRPSKTSTNNEYSYGLEAIVFLCHNEQKFRQLYKHFQECSRRQKLEKPVRNRCKEEFVFTTKGSADATLLRHPILTKTSSSNSIEKVKPDAKSNVLMFNLVQRVDTDGVTHIEVTRPTTERRQHQMLSDGEPSSIISINTPDLGDVKAVYMPSNTTEKLIDGVISTVEDGESSPSLPPSRPQRKKSSSKFTTGSDSNSPANVVVTDHEKVVRGEYVRVSVDPNVVSSPVSNPVSGIGWPPSVINGSQPYPSRLVWRGTDKENTHHGSQSQHRGRSRRTDTIDRHYQQQHHYENTTTNSTNRRRSKSSVILRRRAADCSPKRHQIPYRYAIDPVQINNSLPNRFFGRLKELTVGGGSASSSSGYGSKFRKRRNSIGDVTDGGAKDGGGCRRVNGDGGDARRYDKNHALTKSTPNLKSMIKNKSGKFYKDGYNDNEPKKVTFSAYATVQVVD